MGAEALSQAEVVMFEMEVPLESMENNNVPRYQLVIKLHTRVGTNVAGHQSQTRKLFVLQCFPPFLLQASTLSFSLPCLSELPLHQFNSLTQQKKVSAK